MTETVCPQCATVNTYDELTPHADNFCTECDFPLFWDQMLVPLLATDERTDGALRRLPGVAGRDLRAMRPCLECAEPNLLVSDFCIRCGASMDPPPPPPPPPEPEPEPIEVEPREPPGRDWLLAVLLLVNLGLAAGIILYGVIRG